MGRKKVKQDTESPPKDPNPNPNPDPQSPTDNSKSFHNFTGEEKVVFEYLFYQNRPYNTQYIHDNLGGTIKKGPLQKILDKLTEANKLTAKDFGKVKIYLVNQELIPASNESELLELESEIKQIEQEVESIKNEVKEMQNQAKELENSLSLEEITQQTKERENSLNEVRAEIAELNKAGCVTEEVRKEVEGKLKLAQVEEKKRLRIWNEVLSGIADMLDEPKKKVKELIGIDE